MQLKFEGQTHSIDANTLITVLTHYQNIVAMANQTYSEGSREVRVNVNAIERGSFIIDVTVAQNIMEQLFSTKALEYVASLMTIVGGVYGLYKKFKGRPIKAEKDKEEAAKYIHYSQDINVTINVYNTPAVRQAISKSIEQADEDPSVEGISISDKEVYASFSREEFKENIYDDFDKEEDIPNERNVDVDTTLTIIALSFQSNSRWQFMYNGFKISMNVKEGALMKKIDEGARFGKGDSLKVKLRISQRWNKEYGVYENRGYKIIEFYEHLIYHRPPEMFKENEE